MNEGDRFLEAAREYRGSCAGFCRSCKETETFTRTAITTIDVITEEKTTRRVLTCDGCGYETEEQPA